MAGVAEVGGLHRFESHPRRHGVNPGDYRWCGYAEAVAGKRVALRGLSAILAQTSHGVNREVTWDYTASVDRVLLFGHGLASKGDAQTGAKARRGFSLERIKAEEKREGKLSIPEIDRIRDLRKRASPDSQALPLWAVIRCRVRYFCNGAIFGSVKFVNGIFGGLHRRHGPNRKTGVHKLGGGAGWGEMRTLRNLQVLPVG